MLAVNGHAKHRQSLCRVGYGKTALSMVLFFITTANILATHTFFATESFLVSLLPVQKAGIPLCKNSNLHRQQFRRKEVYSTTLAQNWLQSADIKQELCQ